MKTAASLVHTELKKRVPLYMVPHKIIPISQMPLTKNGKIEKRCLPTLVIADLDSASIFRTNIRMSLDIHIRLWYNKEHE